MSDPARVVLQSLQMLTDRHPLDPERVCVLVRSMVDGSCDDVETAALLAAWRVKGETGEELAAAAQVLREQMVPLDGVPDGLLDTCGTGGDGLATFNVSTAVALVVAGAGVPVVKHGNRAVSSRSGSADVLTALGVRLGGGPSRARRSLEATGLAFCLAPEFHPALARVAPVRRRLGIRTIFNCLGPLANPASASYQLIGVGKGELLEPLAAALSRLGTKNAYVVHGDDGLDEVTLTTTTRVRRVRDGEVESLTWTATDFGLEPVDLRELIVDGPEASAAVIRSVLAGEPGPARCIVLANAAAGLLAAERVGSLAEGVEVARRSIDDGRAELVLRGLQALPEEGQS